VFLGLRGLKVFEGLVESSVQAIAFARARPLLISGEVYERVSHEGAQLGDPAPLALRRVSVMTGSSSPGGSQT
jgi:hypothetical protein